VVTSEAVDMTNGFVVGASYKAVDMTNGFVVGASYMKVDQGDGQGVLAVLARSKLLGAWVVGGALCLQAS
jgi:hypothetical protein